MGRKIKVDPSLVTHIEKGRRLPSPRHLQSFLDLINASADERTIAWALLAQADAERAEQRTIRPQAEAA